MEGDSVIKSSETQQGIVTTIIIYTVVITICIGTLLECMCFILFVYHIFFKKTAAFCNKYFYTISFGYIIAIITLSLALLEYFIPNILGIHIATIISGWYLTLFLGPWNTLLALNRLTALLFWRQNSKIWSKWVFTLCILIVLIYPAVMVEILLDRNCFLTTDKKSCIETIARFDKAQMISNGINVCPSSILGICTVLLLRLKIIKISRDTKKLEIHLLLQSIISVSFFVFYCVFRAISVYLNDKPETLAFYIFEQIIFVFSNCYCLYFHLSSTFLLFCLSETFRKSFLQFYLFIYFSNRRRHNSAIVTPHITTLNPIQSKQTQIF